MEPESMRVPVSFEVPDDIVSRYATNFVAQHTENEFILTFYEVHPPILLGSPDENKAQLEALGPIPATCVARIILSPHGMRQLVDVLQRNLADFDDHAQDEG